MKKILLILAIISIATSCGMTTTKNTTESTEVIEPTEAVYEENFNAKTFKAILQQLNLKSEECYLRFVSEQVVAENKSLTIWLVPKITFYEKDEYGHEAFNLDSYVLLADTETGKIVSQYYNEDEWASDAYELLDITIEEFNQLNDNKIVFGISHSHRASTRVSPTGDGSIQLFAQQGDSLHRIFSYPTHNYHGENDGGFNGNSWLEEYKTELFVTEGARDEYADFILLTNYRLQATENSETVSDSISSDSLRFFSYIENAYKETERDGKTFCKPLEFGKIKCYYYGKTLTEVYQFVYNENKNDKQQYMLPQLPEEDRSYEMKDNNKDNITISYQYEDNKSLNIDFATEYGIEYYTFQEGENVIIFGYDYHD